MEILDVLNISEVLEKKQEAFTKKIHTVHSQYIGFVMGGKVTVLITFDDEPRFTSSEHLEMKTDIEKALYRKF